MLRVECFDLGIIKDEQLSFAVIISRYHGNYLYVKHKDRETLEIPGGGREAGESILACAKRELYEETGAIDYSIKPLFTYGVNRNGQYDYGQVYYAEVFKKEETLSFEISETILLEDTPTNWTYPQIMPILFKKLAV